MGKDKVKNSFVNALTGSLSKVISTILNFIVRTIFIYVLGKEYLGINGLFTNVLMILNFAELGLGNAIIYKLYKPVFDQDKEKIKSLMDFYKKVYSIIGLVIFVIGLAIIPIIPFIINEPLHIKDNLYLIYILFLIESSASYFFSYKRSVLLVYEKNYINDLTDLAFSVLKSIIQVIVLLFMKSYIAYLVIYILSTLLSNVYISFLVNRKYPYLKERNFTKLSIKEIKEIYSNVKALIVFKIGTIVLKGTDNIMISMIINITLVGIYSNYSLIISATSGIMWSLLTGFTGSIGSINAGSTKEKKEDIFNKVLFISAIIYGFLAVVLGNLLSPFVTLWIGDTYLLGDFTVLLLMIILYLNGLNFPQNVYRDTLGLFKEGKLVPLLSAVINIGLSIVLGLIMGINGIFAATAISILLTTFWYIPNVIYNKIFEKKITQYIKQVCIYTIPFIISYIIIYCINLFLTNDIFGFILKTLICISTTILICFFYFRNKNIYKEIKSMVLKKVIGRR